jgi:CDP-diacylglycerol--serine O-phosphatidyltransferase
VRLARFNVEQAGRAKSHFIGLPSPTAGMILATYYPFSQTALFQDNLSHLPWPRFMGIGMVLLSVVMLSHIPYPVVPRIGFKNAKSLIITVVMAACAIGALMRPALFLFPFLAIYTLFGLIRSVGLGLLDRLPERDPLLDEEDEEDQDEAGAELRTLDYGEVAPTRPRRDPSNPQERD